MRPERWRHTIPLRLRSSFRRKQADRDPRTLVALSQLLRLLANT